LADLGKIWRPYSNYIYKENTSASSKILDDEEKITDGGIYSNFSSYSNYIPFNFENENSNPNWARVNSVTKYSPNGNALEEADALGIFSAARYGYAFTQPVMIGKNSRYGSMIFRDFEEITSSQSGHSGNQSALIGAAQSLEIVTQGAMITKDGDHLVEKGAIAKVWIKNNDQLPAESFNLILSSNTSTEYAAKKVAQTGEWTLYSFTIPSNAFSNNTAFGISFKNYGVSEVFIDDFRFQPMEAAANCYVYDSATLRLLAQFDDQHFGVYYQYNGEGKLVRKLIETEKGFKTIQENQYNKPTVARLP
jgi:hypothetical protein